MALREYGVLIGKYDHFELDDPGDPGLYYHGHILVKAPSKTNGAQVLFDCAVDVNQYDKNIQYIILKDIDRRLIEKFINMPDGYHPLGSNDHSGAIDYVRSQYIKEPLGCAALFWAIWSLFTGKKYLVWKVNVGGSALTDLEAMLTDIKKAYILGAPFNNGDGMHDIHFNQGNSRPDRNDPRFNTGDPVADQQKYNQEMGWFLNNGIWQDGIVLFEKNNGKIEGFLVKFEVQSMNTDNNGNPG